MISGTDHNRWDDEPSFDTDTTTPATAHIDDFVENEPGLPRLDVETDLGINGYRAADTESASRLHALLLFDADCDVLARHDTPTDGYWLLYDRSARWGWPGWEEHVTLHVARDPATRTFRLDFEHHAVLPLAQRWLTEKGCQERLDPPHAPAPADEETLLQETRLRDNPHLVVRDATVLIDRGVSTLILEDTRPISSRHFAVYVETTTPDFSAYTVRRKNFNTLDEAEAWQRRYG
ncbi:hypothetical protein [Streptomyces carpaticus]|uniref:hypothetical protein n=1 Tax=Streptomyces carpaticus TaxID=285558 RepID=UPI0031F97433